MVVHQSAIGKTLFYSINQETYLKAFLMNGDIPMDNNLRPYAYLELLLTEIPKHMDEKSLAFLEELPQS